MLGHNAHRKISIHLRKGNSLSECYVGINNITLPEAVYCCLQTCNFCFGELLSWDISVPSFIVIGPSMSKL